jgi:integrase
VLKAALNHAYRDGHCGTDEPWRRVKPFKGADAPVVRAISAAECLRLVKACEPDFRDLVRAALVTGCRYGELTRMRVGDFNQGANTITVRLSKSGKARHVALASEGQRLFEQLTIGRASAEPIFVRADGRIWGASQQQRPLATASKAARVEPAVNFHIPRHTYASTLAMKGVSMAVIAAQLGHSDTRMTERHYAHLAPSYVADTIRAALTDFGFVESPSVLSLRLPA